MTTRNIQRMEFDTAEEVNREADQEEIDFAAKIGALGLPVEFTRYVRSLQRRIEALERRGN